MSSRTPNLLAIAAILLITVGYLCFDGRLNGSALLRKMQLPSTAAGGGRADDVTSRISATFVGRSSDILDDLSLNHPEPRKKVNESFYRVKTNPVPLDYTNFTLDLTKPALQLETEITDYIHQKHVRCNYVVRFGNTGDGGWDTCMDGPFAPKDPCVVYSFGINNDWSFDDDITDKLHCELHAFDPSMNVKSHRRSPYVMFHNIGISGKDYYDNNRKWTMRSFRNMRYLLNHANKPVDYVKMDVEFSEWQAVPAMLDDLKEVKQFVFELHYGASLGVKNVEKIYNFLSSLEKLGFRKFQSNKNFHCQFKSQATGKTYTFCHELYYINTNFYLTEL